MIGPGGSGFPTLPAWTPGLVATFLALRMFTVALRAPVLVVRPQPAPRPGRSTRAPRAGCRSCRRHDVAGSRRGGQLLASSQGVSLARLRHSDLARTAMPIRCADDARECSLRRRRFDAKSSVAGTILDPRGRSDVLSVPDESPVPWLVPAHGHLSTDRGRRCRPAGGGQLASQLSWPAGLRGARCPSLGSGWLLSR